jgi:prepilin-type processing-associated H-X9-DG protein
MYAQDSSDKTVPVFHGGAAQGGNFDPMIGPGWAEGWLDWATYPDNTNIYFLVSERYARLAKYCNRDTNIFKCPSDTYLSPAQRARHWTRRVRSYSAYVGAGPGNAEAGPWDSIYKHVFKTTDFQFPNPAASYVFIEEHPDSINDPAIFSPYQTSWVDTPATYHNGGTATAFADGHCELHKWVGSLSRLRGVAFDFSSITVPVGDPPAGDPDIHWMSYHTPRVAARSY